MYNFQLHKHKFNTYTKKSHVQYFSIHIFPPVDKIQVDRLYISGANTEEKHCFIYNSYFSFNNEKSTQTFCTNIKKQVITIDYVELKKCLYTFHLFLKINNLVYNWQLM